MDRIIFLPSAVLALVLIGLYVVQCWRHRRLTDVGVLVSVPMHCTGMTAGVLLVASTFLPALRVRLNGSDLYFFISGIAVLTVSAQAAARDLGLRRGARRDAPAAVPPVAGAAEPVAARDLATVADAVASR